MIGYNSRNRTRDKHYIEKIFSYIKKVEIKMHRETRLDILLIGVSSRWENTKDF